MKFATTIAQTAVRTLGLIQIGLGVLFWTYNALNLIPLHMLIGLVVVLALWVLGFGLAAIGLAEVLGHHIRATLGGGQQVAGLAPFSRARYR